jgi:hypothetical protein
MQNKLDDESALSAEVVAFRRLSELEKLGVETFNFQTQACMESVIVLLRGIPNWENLPSPIQQSIEQKLYGVFKTIQNVTNDLALSFKDIARQEISTFLEVQEAKEQEEKIKLQEQRDRKIKELTEGNSNSSNNNNVSNDR